MINKNIIHLTPSQCHELSSESQQIRDQLDDTSKSIILTSKTSTNQSSNQTDIPSQQLHQYYKHPTNLHKTYNDNNQIVASNKILLITRKYVWGVLVYIRKWGVC